MSAALWLCIAVVALGLVGTLTSRGLGFRPGIYVAKPTASCGFIGIAVVAGGLDSSYGRTVLVALALCWVGDVMLIPRAKPAFLVGLIAFLLGHVAYVIAFVGLDPRWSWSGASLVVLVPIAVLVGRWLYPHVPSRMRGPVAAYIVVITTMVAAASGASAASAQPLLLVGAIFFFISDISVARERFIKESLANRLWGLPLYYGGQVLLALTVSA